MEAGGNYNTHAEKTPFVVFGNKADLEDRVVRQKKIFFYDFD